jgi:hypothetical protein
MAEVTRRRVGELMQGLLGVLLEHPNGLHFQVALDALAVRVPPSDYEKGTTAKGHSRYRMYVHFNSVGLVKAGWMTKKDGVWLATDTGRAALQTFQDPSEFREEIHRLYRAWRDANPVEDEEDEEEDVSASGESDDDRTAGRAAARAARRRDPEEARELVEELYPRRDDRREAIDFFAEAIVKADALGGDSWGTTLRAAKIHLNVGRVIAAGLYDDEVWVSLLVGDMQPGDLDALEAAGASRTDDQFKLIPGGAIFRVPVASLVTLRPRFEPAFDAFLARAARTSRAVLQQEAHSPGVVRFLESELGRSLPRPGYAPPDDGAPPPRRPAPPRAVAFRQPRVQFRDLHQDLDGLLKLIEIGDVALPDIQRPFVWKPTKVRDLFDSMFRGFPVGTLMLWATSPDGSVRSIGLDPRQRHASRLVVDGQQRLTSLYAVMRGKPVVDESFSEVHIEIAFRPRDGTFDVADAAIRKDPEFIPDISKLWASGKPTLRVAREFLEGLKARRELTHEDEDVISDNLDRLLDLTKYPFTILEIEGDVDEEAVADIFVRINNGGAKLTQADFILTLLSVFSPETRRALEDFSRAGFDPPKGQASPFNRLIQPTADQLLRVAVAVGFHRARLLSVYQLLRGKDPSTGTFSPELREKQFAALHAATAEVLDLTPWHLFIGYLVGAGFRSADLISSENAVLYSYALYLLGRRIGAEERTLARLMSRWFFVAAVSARYSGSSETIMEEDLNRLRAVQDAQAFVDVLETALGSVATNDFWEVTLPHDLETSSSGSPAARAFVAAQVKLGAPVLFSDRRIGDLYDPAIQSHRRTLEGHHLFPRGWLRTQNIVATPLVNQTANLAHLEWPDNAAVSDAAPREYVPALRAQFSAAAWDSMCALHALPPGWEQLEYLEFLKQRRRLMARVIRRGYEALSGTDEAVAGPLPSTPDEKRVWALIEETELALRKLIREKYSTKWADGAEARMRKVLTEKELGDLEYARMRSGKAYPLSGPTAAGDVLDYLYLGQLTKLVQAGETWDQFSGLFRGRKEVLQDLVSKIAPVRNDRAHFRPVPEKELLRCSLACDDLLTLLRTQPSRRGG